MTNKKQIFLHNEIWLLTFGGAFQRANIYKNNVKNGEKTDFRIGLKNFVIDQILPQYINTVDEKTHEQNIQSVVTYSEGWAPILKHGKLLIGVSQKLLNLALKYYWCLGYITTPPHCPLDRIIQQKGLKSKNIVNWTTLNNMDEYLRIMHQIRKVANEKSQSIAEWELSNFERNNV